MDFNKICRMCMSSECLNPIFAKTEYEEKYSKTIFSITGIKVHRQDGLPQNMCSDCINKLNSNITFRMLCERTEKELLKLRTEIDVPEKNEANGLNQGCDYTKCEIYIPEESIEQGIEESCAADAFTNVGKEDSEDSAKDKDSYLLVVKELESKKQRVVCKLCGKNLSIRSLDSHMVCRHPNAEHGRARCQLCHKMVLKSRMDRHQAKAHGAAVPLSCGYCKAEFEAEGALEEHVPLCPALGQERERERARRRGAGGGERGRQRGACDVCGKGMQRASIRHHKAVAHKGLGPVCEHCGKRFANKIRLDEHCRAKHGYEKHRCTFCPFQSSSRMAMRNHERRHRGEKPFVCESCGAKFHAAYLLAQHRQTHRPDKRVQCPLCPAAFKANNSLHMHRLTCHSASTYRCFLCERTFRCRHYVVKHLRHLHAYQGKVPHIQRVEPDKQGEGEGEPSEN